MQSLSILVVVVLVVMAVCSQNEFWIMMMNVANLPGDKFINGLACGIADISCGIVAGLLIHYTSSRSAYQISCYTAMVSCVLYTYVS